MKTTQKAKQQPDIASSTSILPMVTSTGVLPVPSATTQAVTLLTRSESVLPVIVLVIASSRRAGLCERKSRM